MNFNISNLLPRSVVAYNNDWPKFGTVVTGVVFGDQDFKDLPIQEAAAYGEYFDHVLPTSGSPNGCLEIHPSL